MRLIELFEYTRLREWDKCKDVRLYKKYVQKRPTSDSDVAKCEVNVILCFTDEEGIRQCYNTVYFEGAPSLTSNFDMKAMYVALKDSEGKKHFFNQIQFTERYDNFVIFEPLEEIPFDKEGKSANDLELNIIDAKIFEEEEGYDTLYIFGFKTENPMELLNVILLT